MGGGFEKLSLPWVKKRTSTGTTVFGKHFFALPMLFFGLPLPTASLGVLFGGCRF